MRVGSQAQYIHTGTENVILMPEGGRLSVPWLHTLTTVVATYTTNKASILVSSTASLRQYFQRFFFTHLFG